MKKTSNTKSFNGKNRKGFTLVELSVSLVIIALIIGGILGGQDILFSARKSNVISEINQIKTALNNFKAKYYGELPGDFKDAEKLWGASLATDGDGDGRIEKGADDETGETLETYTHLSLAEMYPGKYSGALVSSQYKPGTNIAGSEFSKAAGYLMMHYGSDSDAPSVFGKTGNVIEFGACNSMETDHIYCYNPIMRAEVASEIDSKIDDGLADSGSIFGGDGVNSSGDVEGCSDAITESSASYDLDNETIACRLFFWLD